MAPPEDRAQLVVRHKGLLTVAIMAAMVMQVLDLTITNVSLPHMKAALGASDETIGWVLTSYILASAVAIPITGWLADRIGARRLFLFSVGLFVFTSMLCGVAQNLTEMVLFRTLQGIGGAFLAPLAQSLMLDINKPSEQPRAMSVYGMGIMIGPIMGPIVGGWLTEYLDWRWCFFVNAPVGGACLVGLLFLLPEKPLRDRPFDLLGFSLLAIGLAGLQLMLDRGQSQDWFSSAEIWVEAGVAVCGLWMFGVHLVTARKPLFPPDLLGDRNFLTAILFMFVIGMVMLAALAVMPSLLEGVYGYPVLDTGILLASRGVGVLVTMSIAGRMMKFVDARIMVGGGLALSGVSLIYMTGWSLTQGWGPIVGSGLVQGLGIGFVFVPLQVLAFATLPPHYRTEGAAVLNLSRSIGSSLGIAVVMALLARNMQVSHEDLIAHVTATSLPVDLSQAMLLGPYGSAILGALNGEITRQAAMIAYLDDFYLMAIACFVAVPLALLLRKPRPRPPGADAPAPVMAE
jgi:DHA2 family multidrug resistance protein